MRTISLEDRLALLESRVVGLEALSKEIPASAEVDGERARCLRHVRSLREWFRSEAHGNVSSQAVFHALLRIEDDIRGGSEEPVQWTTKKS